MLSTKVGRILKPAEAGVTPDYGFVDALPFVVEYDYSYDGIMRSHELSLAGGLGSVDILYVHDPRRPRLGKRPIAIISGYSPKAASRPCTS